jgi:hypothetical protein
VAKQLVSNSIVANRGLTELGLAFVSNFICVPSLSKSSASWQGLCRTLLFAHKDAMKRYSRSLRLDGRLNRAPGDVGIPSKPRRVAAEDE